MASKNNNTKTENKKLKISLVLCGGGARGYTHIGVIEELKKYDFEIISIAGTSMGAVIGALEACGKLEIYKKWVTSLDFIDIFKFLKTPFKLDGDKIFKKIIELVGDYNIEDLPIKFTAVATDLTKGKEVWIQKGNIWQAVKASSAIPGVFDPVVINGRMLVDGGVLNLMPVAPVMSDFSDLIIAVNLFGEESNRKFKIPTEIRKKQSFFEDVWNKIFEEKEDPVNQSIDLMMRTIFRYRKAEYIPDIEIKIPENLAGWQEFHRAPELIEIGKQIAKETLEEAKKRGIF
jgi:NTE family protein